MPLQVHAGRVVRDFMGKGVASVYQDSLVGKAVKSMDERNIGSVVVLDNMGPCGVFTERDLVSRVLGKGRDPETTVMTEVMSPRFPSVDTTATLEDAAAAMINKKSRLMAFEGADLVGMVTPTDLVKEISETSMDFSILKVISTRMVTALPETPVDVVVRLMDENRVGSVLVSGDGKWTGIFTERDLVKKVLAKKRKMDTPVGEFNTAPLVVADPGILGRDAAGMMAKHGFKRLPLVLNGEGVGIVTARDIVEAFATAQRPLAPRVNWVQWN